MPTLWQTSLMRWAVMSLISPWWIDGNPPLGLDKFNYASIIVIIIDT